MNQQNKIDFTAYLQAKNIWETTIEKYILQIEKFEQWSNARGGSPQTAQKKDILDYLQVLQNRNLSGSTRQHRLGILAHYYTFLYKTDQTFTNPTTGIKLRGTRKKVLPSIITIEEMEELLDTHFLLKVQHTQEKTGNRKGKLEVYRHTPQRNHLILSFCIYQGLNRSEWQELTLDDIDMQKATIHIKAQRKTNARILPLHATQIGMIYMYLNEARPLFNLNNHLLFNPKFQPHPFIIELKNLYPKFEDFTQLRASIITYWIKTEGLRKAQYKAGHRYISSTEQYLANDLESLKEDITRFHPL